jgi:short-chain fatty acids transporter
MPGLESTESPLAALAQRACAWAEQWFPDAFAFAIVAVAVVAAAAVMIGVPAPEVALQFGTGFWSLIPFTMQMCFIVIGGYVVADSPPLARLVRLLARRPRSPRGAVGLVATVSIGMSMLHWGLSLVLGSLLVRALARREDLAMDYRAAGAACCLGTGSVWALGLSSSAAQLQANAGSMPPALLRVTGVIPFAETIFLWQSLLLAAVLGAVGIWIAWLTAPDADRAVRAAQLGVRLSDREFMKLPPRRPAEYLEHSPFGNVFLVLLIAVYLAHEVRVRGPGSAISSLNNYNLLFLALGLLLQWRPRRFLDAVADSVPAVTGILIQFPLLGSIAAIMTSAATADGRTLATLMGHAFARYCSHDTFAVAVGVYSAILGLFMPSGGGKWVIEAPYVMQAANELRYHLGWAVQVYNAAEALPNLINPFWMLPVLGILGLRARDLIGFTAVQFLVSMPLVLFLLWLLGMTLTYHPPVMPS